jgi:ferredoxin-NADP reductase
MKSIVTAYKLARMVYFMFTRATPSLTTGSSTTRSRSSSASVHSPPQAPSRRAGLSDEPAGTDWGGARGFAHDVAKAHFNNNFAGYNAYLCGPPVMIEACIATLMQGRLYERDIYTEKFLSAVDTNQQRSPLFKRV